ncbi:MAG: Gfo/Idh/MocA family oxidoreductase [Oscillospiraceae bacterium]|nr:Gfo/Idh/MocA family oxidoreductase [Oscillospiraceae bacterium]
MGDYKWGILGPGNIANKFMTGLGALPNAVPCAAGSRDLNRAKDFAKKYNLNKAYGSYDELAADPEIDIIYIATTHPHHEEAAIKCLNAKKAVICEKPFAANAAQAARMIDCARSNRVFLMEAMWTRFLPHIKKTMELISQGAIGEVRHVNADFGFRAGVNPEGRLFSPDTAGGSLLDVGVYNISFCNMIFGGPPETISSQITVGSTGVDEIASALLGYKGKKSAFALSAIRLNTPQEALIYGEEGSIKLSPYWCGDTILLNNKDGFKEIKLPFGDGGFQYEAMEVMDCLDKNLLESPVMPLDETLEVMKCLDEIRYTNNLRYPFESDADTVFFKEGK